LTIDIFFPIQKAFVRFNPEQPLGVGFVVFHRRSDALKALAVEHHFINGDEVLISEDQKANSGAPKSTGSTAVGGTKKTSYRESPESNTDDGSVKNEEPERTRSVVVCVNRFVKVYG